jgi:VWFA-related protein
MVKINGKKLNYKICLLISLFLTICFGSFTTNGQNQQPDEEKKADKISVLFGVVADNTGSMRSILENIIATTKKIAEAKKPEDEMFLVRFVSSGAIQILAPLTTDKNIIKNQADNFFVEGGQSAIIDALYLSANGLSKTKKCAASSCKRSLILISDGEERESHHKIEQLLKLLKENNIKVFTIRLVEKLKKNNGDDSKNKQVTFLKDLSAQTGGKSYLPKSVEETDVNIKEIIETIRQ